MELPGYTGKTVHMSCYSTLELCVGQVSLLQVVRELDSLATSG